MKAYIRYNGNKKVWVATKMVNGSLCRGVGISPSDACIDCQIDEEMLTFGIHQ